METVVVTSPRSRVAPNARRSALAAKDDSSQPSDVLLEIRKLAIVAMFADDVLLQHLVLKGGNALDIVLGITGRTSVDLDFSIEGDFKDVNDIKRRAQKAIKDRFDSAGFEVFD